MKICAKCEIEKTLTEFSLSKGRPHSWCKMCRNKVHQTYKQSPGTKGRTQAYAKEYVQRDYVKAARWERYLMAKYGITPAQYESMLDSQDHKCAVPSCRSQLGTGTSKHLDHCHATGKLRGILCRNCNVGIGCARDNPDILLGMIAYLESHVDQRINQA